MEFVLVDFTNYKKAIEIQNEIFPEEDGTVNILASLDRNLFIEKTGMNYVDDHVKCYIVYDNNEEVGITGLYHYDNESAWLPWFGVLPNKRRKSYGKKILLKTIDMAKQRGFKTMRLYTDRVENAIAIKLYEKIGFVGEKYSAEELTYDCYIYSKSLCDEQVKLWNNKLLGLSYQSQLDHLSKDKIEEILKLY